MRSSPSRSSSRAGDLGVLGEGLELLAPGVEAEVDARARRAGAVEHEDRARSRASTSRRSGSRRPSRPRRTRRARPCAEPAGAAIAPARRRRSRWRPRRSRLGRLEVLLPRLCGATGQHISVRVVRRPLGGHPPAHSSAQLPACGVRSSCFSTTLWISLRISARPGGLDGAGLERLAPVADRPLAGELVEVRARHRQADLGVGGDVARDLAGRAPRRGRAGCRRGRAARAPSRA